MTAQPTLLAPATCECGAASIRSPGHSDWCPAHLSKPQTPGARFWELYRKLGSTVATVEQLAPQLVNGSHRVDGYRCRDNLSTKIDCETCLDCAYGEVDAGQFWAVFGPAVEIGQPGLEWCFNQREMDTGGLACRTGENGNAKWSAAI